MIGNPLQKTEYIQCSGEEKIRIAIMYQVASYWPTIESFYGECVKDKDVEVRIFFVDKTSVEKAQVEGSELFLDKENISYETYNESAIRGFRPHVALYQPPYDVSYRNPDALSIHLMEMGIRIVYIPYGIEIADTEDARWNHFHTFVVRNAWRIYTFSEMMKADYWKYCPNRYAVRALGIPKFDSIAYKERIAKGEMAEAAGGRQIILWKMHFPKLIYEGDCKKQVTPYMEEYIKFAEKVEAYEDLFFVVMPHPMFFSQTIDGGLAEKARELLDILAKKANVHIDRTADYRTSLYHADAIMVDRSAIMIEAGFLDVPVLYMKNADYDEPLTEAVRTLMDSYEQGCTCEDMCNFVDAFRRKELDCVSSRIAEVRNRILPYRIGESGRNILEDIKSGVKEQENSVIRVAFFGAGYICEHYINELHIKNNSDFECVSLADNDKSKWGTEKVGIPVVSPEELRNTDVDLIVISSEQYYMPIKKKLVYEWYIAEEKIIRLDQFAQMYISKYNS